MTEQEIIATQLKAMAIYDANNTSMTVEECAAFLNKNKRTILRRINSADPHNKIHATYNGGWSIPKIQFLEKIIEDWNNTHPTSLKAV